MDWLFFNVKQQKLLAKTRWFYGWQRKNIVLDQGGAANICHLHENVGKGQPSCSINRELDERNKVILASQGQVLESEEKRTSLGGLYGGRRKLQGMYAVGNVPLSPAISNLGLRLSNLIVKCFFLQLAAYNFVTINIIICATSAIALGPCGVVDNLTLDSPMVLGACESEVDKRFVNMIINENTNELGAGRLDISSSDVLKSKEEVR
ncbi:hypothetical protein DKX38_003015 [Salix brachista]|uniref:Uncharacterized protein n=1 Tax=Salix brachista TaxID=2182728 RepID=A0A5N5NPK6_9ROSI|nr:hypothetical protein DKX38_003015 [Salix brachista]